MLLDIVKIIGEKEKQKKTAKQMLPWAAYLFQNLIIST